MKIFRIMLITNKRVFFPLERGTGYKVLNLRAEITFTIHIF